MYLASVHHRSLGSSARKPLSARSESRDLHIGEFSVAPFQIGRMCFCLPRSIPMTATAGCPAAMTSIQEATACSGGRTVDEGFRIWLANIAEENCGESAQKGLRCGVPP